MNSALANILILEQVRTLEGFCAPQLGDKDKLAEIWMSLDLIMSQRTTEGIQTDRHTYTFSLTNGVDTTWHDEASTEGLLHNSLAIYYERT